MQPPTTQKVVIVEDNASLSDIYKTRLETIGYQCFAAYDGQTALATIEREKPDLVLLDLMVPKIAGDQILATMRAHDWGKNIKVLVISNLNEADAPAGLRAQGIEGYAIKANLSNDQLDLLVDNILKPANQSEDVSLESPAMSMERTEPQSAPVTDLTISYRYELPVATVWRAWTEADVLMRWWGPDNFSCPSAILNVYPGGLSIVAMKASDDMGGQTYYSSWAHVVVQDLNRLEFIHNLSDANGRRIDPVSVGMPSGFPQGLRYVVEFIAKDNMQTELIVTEYGWPDGQLRDMSELGMHQSLAKLATALAQ